MPNISVPIADAQTATNAIGAALFALEASLQSPGATVAEALRLTTILHAALASGEALLVKSAGGGSGFQPQDGGTGKPPPPSS